MEIVRIQNYRETSELFSQFVPIIYSSVIISLWANSVTPLLVYGRCYDLKRLGVTDQFNPATLVAAVGFSGGGPRTVDHLAACG